MSESDDYMIEVTHADADTVSFVADEEGEAVKMYLIDMDGETPQPIAEVASFSPAALDMVMEQMAGAKHQLEGVDPCPEK